MANKKFYGICLTTLGSYCLDLIITTPLLWWFTHTIVKPITNLQKAANSGVRNFKVDNELANHGPEELREVGQSFNKMSIAIDNLISNQHNLLSSISHELKTPLTRFATFHRPGSSSNRGY